MYKRRRLFLMVATLLTFCLGGVLLAGCGGSSGGKDLAGIVITPDVSVVNLELNISDASGEVIPDSGSRTGKVRFDVTNVPSTVSRTITVRSLNPSIVAVQEVNFGSNGQTVVTLQGLSSGNTRIEAMAIGGNTMTVDVVVDIPARDLTVRPNVHFGVLRGETIKIDTIKSFDFFPVARLNGHFVSTTHRATLNDVEFEPISSPGVEMRGDGSTLFVPSTYRADTVTLRPKLVRSGVNSGEDITVHVFDALPDAANGNSARRVSITQAGAQLPISSRPTASGLRGTYPYLTMVLNAPPGRNYPVTNSARLELSMIGNPMTGDKLDYRERPFDNHDARGIKWGFSLIDLNESERSALNAWVDPIAGVINLTAQGAREVQLGIKFYPIAVDGTAFNLAAHSALQVIHTVNIEIRNVFHEDTLTFSQDHGILDRLNVFNAVEGSNRIVLEEFGLGILTAPGSDTLSMARVENTTNDYDASNARNNQIQFYLVDRTDGTVIERNPLDFFVIRAYGSEDDTVGLALGRVGTSNFTSAASYSSRFAINVIPRENSEIFRENQGRDLWLYARSVRYASVVASVPLRLVQSVDEIAIMGAESDGSNGQRPTAVIKDNNLFPVIPASSSEGVKSLHFFVQTDQEHVPGDFWIDYHGDAGNMFRVHQRSSITAVGRTSWWELETLGTSEQIRGRNYTFDIVHASRSRLTISIMPLRQWLADPNVEILDSSPGVYSRTFDEQTQTLTAFIRINGSYDLSITTNPVESFSYVEFRNFPLMGLGRTEQRANRYSIFADKEGSYQFTMIVHTPNPELIAGRNHVFTVRIIVVNPVSSAKFLDENAFNMDGRKLYSKDSLGYDTDMKHSHNSVTMDQSESWLRFKVELGYSDNHPDNLDFTGGDFPVQRVATIDFAIRNMVMDVVEVDTTSGVTVPVRWRSSAIEIEREVLNGKYTNWFTVHALHGNRFKVENFEILFFVDQQYVIDGENPVHIVRGLEQKLSLKIEYATAIDMIVPDNIDGVYNITLDNVGNGANEAGTKTWFQIPFTYAPMTPAPYNNNDIGIFGYGFLNRIIAPNRCSGKGVGRCVVQCSPGICYELVLPERENPSDPNSDRWSVIRDPYTNTEIIRVNVLTGDIWASTQNIMPNVEVSLVIYALHSYDARVAGMTLEDANDEGKSLFPTMAAIIPIKIYERSARFDQRVINTPEEFLRAFYTVSGIANPTDGQLIDAARGVGGRGRLLSRTNLGVDGNSLHYQLAANINVAGFELPPIRNFGVQEPLAGGGISAMFTGERFGAENYAIQNFRMSHTHGKNAGTDSGYYVRSYSDGSPTGLSEGGYANYGFFGIIGRFGVVECITFEGVTGNVAGLNYLTETRFGIVAAVNNGTVRDVAVEISSAVVGGQVPGFLFRAGDKYDTDILLYPRLYNIGLVVGLNVGTVVETVHGRISSTGRFNFYSGEVLAPVNFGGIVGNNEGRLIKDGKRDREDFTTNSNAVLMLFADDTTYGYGWGAIDSYAEQYYINIGGVAGRNEGWVNGYSSEAVIYNSAYGNTGGLVGYNVGARNGSGETINIGGSIMDVRLTPINGVVERIPRGVIENGYSNSAMYARSAMGGVVGRNQWGLIDTCHYDLYLNEQVITVLWDAVFGVLLTRTSDWGSERLYAGMIVGRQGSNNNYDTNANGFTDLTRSPTTVGGVVGVNDSGDVRYSYASSTFPHTFEVFERMAHYESLEGMPYRGDIYIHAAANVIVGGVVGRQESKLQDNEGVPRLSTIEGCYSSLNVGFDSGRTGTPIQNGAPVIGGLVGFLNDAHANIEYSYSNMGVKVWRNAGTSATTYAGYWAHGKGYDKGDASNGVKFDRCYSITDSSSATAPTVILPESSSPTQRVIAAVFGGTYTGSFVGFDQSAVVAPSASVTGFTGITAFIGEEQARINALRSAFNTGSWQARQHFMYYDTAENQFPYPLIFRACVLGDACANKTNCGVLPFETHSKNPLVMVAPIQILPRLFNVLEYAGRYGMRPNNMGGFNYVIPSTNPANLDKRAALFHTTPVGGGWYNPLNEEANKYRIIDLLGYEVSAAIASGRIRYEVVDPQGVTSTGMEMGEHYIEVLRPGTFELELISTRFASCIAGSHHKGCVTLPNNGCGRLFTATNSVTFDIVHGINSMSVSMPGMLMPAHKSLLNTDTVVNGQASVQKNIPFGVTGTTVGARPDLWDFDIYGGVHDHYSLPCYDSNCLLYMTHMRVDGADQPLDVNQHLTRGIIPRTSPPRSMVHAIGTGAAVHASNTTFSFFQYGQMKLMAVPFVESQDGTEKYQCLMLAVEIDVRVYGGAIELKYLQSPDAEGDNHGENIIDPSTRAANRGIFTTDVTYDIDWGWQAEWDNDLDGGRQRRLNDLKQNGASRLLDLMQFYWYPDGNNANEGRPIFEKNSLGQWETSRTMPINGNISMHFELRVEDVKEVRKFGELAVDGYYRYEFAIYAGIVVDADGRVYDGLGTGGVTGPLIDNNTSFTGRIEAKELKTIQHISGGQELTASAYVEVIPQELQSALLRHLSDTEPVRTTSGTIGNALRVDENQTEADRIYHRQNGGLLQVHAVPYYANIDSFRVYHDKSAFTEPEEVCNEIPCICRGCNSVKPWMQLIGYYEEDIGYNNVNVYPVYQEFGIALRQMEYNTARGIYEPTGVAGRGTTGISPRQISNVRTCGLHVVTDSCSACIRSWTGTYYIETILEEIEGAQFVGEGRNWQLKELHERLPLVPLSDASYFDLIAEFQTNGRQIKVNVTDTQPYSMRLYASQEPGLSFHYNKEFIKAGDVADHVIGTKVPFTVTGVPAGKVFFETREVRINGVIVEGGENEQWNAAVGVPAVGSSDPRYNLVKVTYDSEAQTHYLEIMPELYFANNNAYRDARIEVRFTYTMERDNTDFVEGLVGVLEIRPVLFKINGFRMEGWTSRNGTVHQFESTLGPTRNAKLEIVSTRPPQENAALTAVVGNAIATLQTEINHGVERDWLLWTAVGGRLNEPQLTGSLTTQGKQYENGVKNLNFILGERLDERGRPTKFITKSSNESLSSAFSVEMAFLYDENGIPVLHQNFGERGVRRAMTQFEVVTFNLAPEDAPTPINTVTELRAMQAGRHYILMQDIELPPNWEPLPFRAASLDGNSRKITVNGFNIAGLSNIGVFSVVEVNTETGATITPVLKNINIALPEGGISIDLNTAYSTSLGTTGSAAISIGLLAGVNGGVITNCAVVRDQQFRAKVNLGDLYGVISTVDYSRSTFAANRIENGAQVLNINIDHAGFSVRTGGLVGTNNARGVVSNSRAMIDVRVSSTGVTAREVFVAGFAGINLGTITSSFFRDASVRNAISVASPNLTAGFVGRNDQNGRILGCYAMGNSANTALDNEGAANEGQILGLDAVAGFTAENSGGNIENCYASVRLVGPTRSGFVHNNTGNIKNCIANIANPLQEGGIAGFVRIGNASNIVNGLYISGRNFTLGVGGDAVAAANLGSIALYRNRSFSVHANKEQGEVIAIWQMTERKVGSAGLVTVYLPELVSANDIAVGARYQDSATQAFGPVEWHHNLCSGTVHHDSCLLPAGTKQNPVLITNGEQFNRILFQDSGASGRESAFNALDWQTRQSQPLIDYESNVYKNHMRLIDNIQLPTGTQLHTFKTIYRDATFDGNGLEVRNIAVPADSAVLSSDNIFITTTGLRSVGLFSKLEYATVKNMTLVFAGNVAASGANYAGGLAGVSINSNISDVNLTASMSNEVRGRSIVGGLVGMAVVFDVSGGEQSTSRIQYIQSNLSVAAVNGAGTPIIPRDQVFNSSADAYIERNYYDNSVAGGVIGMITGRPRADRWVRSSTQGAMVHSNLDNILRRARDGSVIPLANIIPSQRPSEPDNRDSHRAFHVRDIKPGLNQPNLSGEILGGFFGMIDTGITVARANLNTSGTSPNYSGKFYIGGLAGMNFGTLTQSGFSTPQSNTVSMQVNSMAGSSFIYYATTETCLQGCFANQNCTHNQPVVLQSAHYGMTVGGAVGFNRGIVDKVHVAISLGGTGQNNFPYIWRVGGLVGENSSGTVRNSGFGTLWELNATPLETWAGTLKESTSTVINGGFYIGGLIGLNNGTNTKITGNRVNVSVSGWGQNYDGEIMLQSGETSIFAEERPIQINKGNTANPTKAGDRPFLQQTYLIKTGNPERIARSLTTGGIIGVNTDNTVPAQVGGQASNLIVNQCPGNRRTGTAAQYRN